MSNYTSLKATINANIKANGNQEITGPVLNSVLTAMVNSLGAGFQFVGVATPSADPGTPDYNVFYIATEAGTYTNFGGLVVDPGEVAILQYNGTWAKTTTGIGDIFGDADADFIISDDNNFSIVVFENGHIRTKYFNSADFGQLSPVIDVVSRYAGKKISILGDSITTFGDPSATNENGTYCYSYYPEASCRYSVDGVDSIAFDVEKTYWMRLIRQTGMVLGINDSYRGTKVAGTNKAFNLQSRIDHLGENGTPDVILIFGGTNDAGNGVTIGTFNTENPQNYTDQQIADLPVSTFADGYRAMLIRAMKTYPLAEIVVILPTFTSSYYTITNLDLYVEVIKEACDFFGIKYIDARCTGINIYNRATYLVDGIHPNEAGMELLYRKIYRDFIFA